MQEVNNGGSRFKLCLFCSYSKTFLGINYADLPPSAPVKFEAQQQVSINALQQSGVPEIGLYYTDDEFEEVVQKICLSIANKAGILEKGALEYVKAVTDGHPDAVASILKHILSVSVELPLEYYLCAVSLNISLMFSTNRNSRDPVRQAFPPRIEMM